MEIRHKHEESEEVPELWLGAVSNLRATCSFEKVLFAVVVCVFS